MKQKYAFILSLLLALLVAANVFVLSNFNEDEIKTVQVKRVIDGDTLILQTGETIRLININAPEKNRLGYNEAASFLKQLENQTISLELLGTDKYRRTLARVYSKDNYVNLEIVKQGFANKYLVRDNELAEFIKAEERAINSEKGIWKSSGNLNCLKLKKNKKQTIEITNSCNFINLTDWALKDESRKEYNFQSISINSNETIEIMPGIEAIWSEKRNSIYIFDAEGNLVHYQTFGY